MSLPETAHKGIVAGTAHQRVIAGAAIKGVIAFTAVDFIIAVPAHQHVIVVTVIPTAARTAEDHVIAATTLDLVIPAVTGQGVGHAGTDEIDEIGHRLRYFFGVVSSGSGFTRYVLVVVSENTSPLASPPSSLLECRRTITPIVEPA